MKSRIKRYAGNGFLLLIMIILYSMAAANSRTFGDGKSAFMLYKKTDFLNGSQAADLQYQNDERERPFVFTLWGTKKKQEISGQENGRKTNAEVISICGSSDLLFPRDVVLDEEDRQSCLLSGDLAYRLYGSKEIAGLEVIYQDREYQIKGVLEAAEQTLVIQSDQKTDAIMDAAALAVPRGRLSSLEAGDFKQIYGDADFEVDLNAVTGWGRFIVNILPVCMLGVLIGNAVKKTAAWRRFPVKCFVLAVCLALAVASFASLADWKTGLSFPYVPAQWSDFEHWKEVAKELQKSLTDFMTSEKRTPEHMVVGNVLQTLWYLVISITIFICHIRKLRPAKESELLFYSVISLGGVFLAVLLRDSKSRYLVSNTGVWLLLPCFLLVQYVLSRIKAPGNADA